MKFWSFLCTKWMENCEVMTSSTHSFAYSYGLVKKCFLKICETSKFHNFLIFQPIFIRFSLFCSENFTLSSEIKLDQLRTSPLNCFHGRLEFYSRWHVFGLDIGRMFQSEGSVPPAPPPPLFLYTLLLQGSSLPRYTSAATGIFKFDSNLSLIPRSYPSRQNDHALLWSLVPKGTSIRQAPDFRHLRALWKSPQKCIFIWMNEL